MWWRSVRVVERYANTFSHKRHTHIEFHADCVCVRAWSRSHELSQWRIRHGRWNEIKWTKDKYDIFALRFWTRISLKYCSTIDINIYILKSEMICSNCRRILHIIIIIIIVIIINSDHNFCDSECVCVNKISVRWSPVVSLVRSQNEPQKCSLYWNEKKEDKRRFEILNESAHVHLNTSLYLSIYRAVYTRVWHTLLLLESRPSRRQWAWEREREREMFIEFFFVRRRRRCGRSVVPFCFIPIRNIRFLRITLNRQ